ncbi:hypothetical protein MHH56_23905 [Paenibacillus sp. FSL K6-3182]|uniref:hypothetical protein n=1 Tax=Paenibacillus sp. FSL K6-3182 TaxID=2921495 RepID=UPI0030CCE929
MIIERTTSGRRVRTKSGLWPGERIPFGYSWDKPTQQLIIIPEEATLIRAIYNSYLDGHSRLAISEWASQRSKARVFDHTILRDILHRAINNEFSLISVPKGWSTFQSSAHQRKAESNYRDFEKYK